MVSYATCGLTLPPTGVEEAERVNANSAADSFLFEGGEDCRPYARMNVDEEPRTNNFGGIVDVQSVERMYQTSNDPNLDGLSCMRKYISKRNDSCENFLPASERKKKGAEESDGV